MSTRIGAYDYTLPTELIAQTPIEPRDSSRLLVVHRARRRWSIASSATSAPTCGRAICWSPTRAACLPARLLGVKEGSGGRVELLLLAIRGDRGPDHWEALARPGRRIQRRAAAAYFGDGLLTAEVLERDAVRRADRAAGGARGQRWPRRWQRVGSMPLPPYIHTPLADSRALPDGLCARPWLRRRANRWPALHAGAAGALQAQGDRAGLRDAAHRPRYLPPHR